MIQTGIKYIFIISEIYPVNTLLATNIQSKEGSVVNLMTWGDERVERDEKEELRSLRTAHTNEHMVYAATHMFCP